MAEISKKVHGRRKQHQDRLSGEVVQHEAVWRRLVSNYIKVGKDANEGDKKNEQACNKLNAYYLSL